MAAGQFSMLKTDQTDTTPQWPVESHILLISDIKVVCKVISKAYEWLLHEYRIKLQNAWVYSTEATWFQGPGTANRPSEITVWKGVLYNTGSPMLYSSLWSNISSRAPGTAISIPFPITPPELWLVQLATTSHIWGVRVSKLWIPEAGLLFAAS